MRTLEMWEALSEDTRISVCESLLAYYGKLAVKCSEDQIQELIQAGILQIQENVWRSVVTTPKGSDLKYFLMDLLDFLNDR